MPRPLITTPGLALGPHLPQVRAAPARPGRGSTLLRHPRSARFREALGCLDASTSVARAALDRAVAELHDEYTDSWATAPLGLVGPCYLGPPYEAHTLLWDEEAILDHFAGGQPLPGHLERARHLAVSGAYACIEVYPDQLVCVRTDGSVTRVEG